MRALSFFSNYEWWYHITMMPFLLAAGNYYFIGERYFLEPDVFLIATGLVFLLYWFSIVTLTILIRWVIARFPERKQTTLRLVVMLVSVAVLTVALAVFDVWVYSLVPMLEVAFTWMNIVPIILLGFLFDILLCAALGLFYTFDKWKQNQAESEVLERKALQMQFNELKGQINPHFLFNSLNSLSALIEEDPDAAESFVEDLSVVYRYVLQASRTEIVNIAEEISFLRVYARLLKVRYGDGLVIDLPHDQASMDTFLPPLTLQILLDNAIRYNQITGSKPLYFSVMVTCRREVAVQNNIQLKVRLTGEKTPGLKTLKAKYRDLGDIDIGVMATDRVFAVTLPYLDELK